MFQKVFYIFGREKYYTIPWQKVQILVLSEQRCIVTEQVKRPSRTAIYVSTAAVVILLLARLLFMFAGKGFD